MTTAFSEPDDHQYEQIHVHEIYDKIAPHFSSTRYKPWPVVDEFLKQLPPGSIGLDVGCGNGKYLTVSQDIFIVASDRSSELLKYATLHQPHSAIIADTLNLPHPPSTFDFAISIAVVHHLSSSIRRRNAIGTVLEALRPGTGQALFFVWALEQKESRRGWDKDDEQDVLVPWVLKRNMKAKEKHATQGQQEENPTVYQRYYHLYRQGELEEDVVAAGGQIVRSGYDRDNWWTIAERHAS